MFGIRFVSGVEIIESSYCFCFFNCLRVPLIWSVQLLCSKAGAYPRFFWKGRPGYLQVFFCGWSRFQGSLSSEFILSACCLWFSTPNGPQGRRCDAGGGKSQGGSWGASGFAEWNIKFRWVRDIWIGYLRPLLRRLQDQLCLMICWFQFHL